MFLSTACDPALTYIVSTPTSTALVLIPWLTRTLIPDV